MNIINFERKQNEVINKKPEKIICKNLGYL